MKELFPTMKLNELFTPMQLMKILSFSVNTGCEIDEAIEKLNIKTIKMNKRAAIDVILSYKE